MSTTYRNAIKDWVRKEIEEGDLDELDDLISGAQARFGADPDVIRELAAVQINVFVRQIYPAITKSVRRSPEQLRKEIEAAAPASPFAALVAARDTSILIDVAAMTRVEVSNLATRFEDQSTRELQNAAFLRVLASTLNGDERVRDRFTREDLLRMRGRITINPKVEIYVGDRLHSIAQGRAS